MRNKGSVKSILAAVIAGSTLLLGAGSAFAFSFPGYSGKPIVASQAGCLTENNGSVINTCGAQAGYEIPLVTGTGSQTFSLATNNPGGGTFQCTLYSVSNTGVVTTGTTVFPNTGNRTNSLNVVVSAASSVFVFCNINAGGKIYNISQ
jgi:hypothetical protein